MSWTWSNYVVADIIAADNIDRDMCHDITKPSPASDAAATAGGRPLTNEVIVKQYADPFTGIRRLEGDVHLEIDPIAKLVQMPPR